MPHDIEEALRRFRECAGTQWDPAFVQLFVDLAESGLADRVAAEAPSFGLVIDVATTRASSWRGSPERGSA